MSKCNKNKFIFHPRNPSIKFHSIKKRKQSSKNKSFRIFVWKIGKCFYVMSYICVYRWLMSTNFFAVTIEFHSIILLQSIYFNSIDQTSTVSCVLFYNERQHMQNFNMKTQPTHQYGISIIAYDIASMVCNYPLSSAQPFTSLPSR